MVDFYAKIAVHPHSEGVKFSIHNVKIWGETSEKEEKETQLSASFSRFMPFHRSDAQGVGTAKTNILSIERRGKGTNYFRHGKKKVRFLALFFRAGVSA